MNLSPCKRVDGDKKIKGRKEHIVVKTLGFPMTTAIHPANIHDPKCETPAIT